MPTSKGRHYHVTLGDAIGAHERALKFGGRAGTNDIGLVEAAIQRPYSGYYRPIYKKAAALVHSIATNHGFTDGNKRTAFLLLLLFVEQSGYELRPSSSMQKDEELEHLILDVVTKFLLFDEIVLWFRNRLRRTSAQSR